MFDFVKKAIPIITNHVPPYFKNTALGRGVLGLGSVKLFDMFCKLTPLNNLPWYTDKIIVPICIFGGLLYDQYPRFDDKAHLGATALASCGCLFYHYGYYKIKLAEVNDEARHSLGRYNASDTGGYAIKYKELRVKYDYLVGFFDLPSKSALSSLFATGVLELGRYATSRYNER